MEARAERTGGFGGSSFASWDTLQEEGQVGQAPHTGHQVEPDGHRQKQGADQRRLLGPPGPVLPTRLLLGLTSESRTMMSSLGTILDVWKERRAGGRR